MYSITQFGKQLNPNLYTIDESNKTFSSKEDNLILDFSNESGWSFKTGYDCTFHTTYYCIFNTGANCTFKTGSSCTFNTESNCTFKTVDYCIFNTGYDCTFNTGSSCTFKTVSSCTFKTVDYCIFNTGYDCIFNTGYDCTFIILNNAFIKCKDESPITILQNDYTKINTLTIPNQIMYINKDSITTWTNKDLILNCKDPNFKDACNFFMKKD